MLDFIEHFVGMFRLTSAYNIVRKKRRSMKLEHPSLMMTEAFMKSTLNMQ
jgi:hypothetical protein